MFVRKVAFLSKDVKWADGEAQPIPHDAPSGSLVMGFETAKINLRKTLKKLRIKGGFWNYKEDAQICIELSQLVWGANL